MHSSMRSWVAGPWSILLTFQVINGNGLSAGVGAETAFESAGCGGPAFLNRTFKMAPTDYSVMRRRISQLGKAARLR